MGIGTSSPYSKLTVWGSDTASTSAFAVVNSASTTVFSAYDNGTVTYSGLLFQSSDQRLKTDIASLDASTSLSLVTQLNPVSYTRIDQPSQGTTLGFLAQEVQKLFPSLVTVTDATPLTPGGTLTLNYTGLIAPIVKAIQEVTSIGGTFKTNLIAFLGSATNGLTDFFAAVGNFGKVNTQQLCVTDSPSDSSPLCLTKPQVAALLSQAGASSLPTSVTSSSGSQVTNSGNPGNTNSTPPVITITGANPATIPTGTTYADLGATISGPQADLNLGLTLVIDDATSTDGSVEIDTSEPATHTILYTVTDPSGLTGSATRTVIVSPASTPQAANDNTTPAANDNNQSGNATGTTGQ